MGKKPTYEELEQRVKELEEECTEQEQALQNLRSIQWLLAKSVASEDVGEKHYAQPYGNLVELNAERVVLDAVGESVLADIVRDYLDLLDTSAAVYERNGDYAFGIFPSSWCRILDQASRALCNTDDNAEALKSGKWHCHESCWTEASKVSIEMGRPVDIECRGGIRLYAIPIWAGTEIVGSINFGYGDPPRDPQKLDEIGRRFSISTPELIEHAKAYQSRPTFMIDLAKSRLATSASLIGQIVKRKRAEGGLRKAHDDLERRVEERTAELRQVSSKLLHAHEEESRRIGQELHDGLAQTLSAVKVWGEAAVEQVGRESRVEVLNSLENIVSLSQSAVEEVRRISLNLRPSLLDDLGLLAAIQWLCKDFEATHPGIGIQKQIEIQENDVPEPLKIIIFRISQEALNNIGKHSQASLVHFSLRRIDGNRIEWNVTDNGTGFDLDQVRSGFTLSRGLGLDSMKERVELSGGSFSIKPDRDTGTIVRASWEC